MTKVKSTKDKGTKGRKVKSPLNAAVVKACGIGSLAALGTALGCAVDGERTTAFTVRDCVLAFRKVERQTPRPLSEPEIAVALDHAAKVWKMRGELKASSLKVMKSQTKKLAECSLLFPAAFEAEPEIASNIVNILAFGTMLRNAKHDVPAALKAWKEKAAQPQVLDYLSSAVRHIDSILAMPCRNKFASKDAKVALARWAQDHGLNTKRGPAIIAAAAA